MFHSREDLQLYTLLEAIMLNLRANELVLNLCVMSSPPLKKSRADEIPSVVFYSNFGHITLITLQVNMQSELSWAEQVAQNTAPV